MIWGNHDMVYRDPKYVEKHLSIYFDEKIDEDVELFCNIQYHEGIILKHSETQTRTVFNTWSPSRLVELYILEMESFFGSCVMETTKCYGNCRSYKSSEKL